MWITKKHFWLSGQWVVAPPPVFRIILPAEIKNSVPAHTHDTIPPKVILPNIIRHNLPNHTHDTALPIQPSPPREIRNSIPEHSH
jgi:hypothetical protein